MDGLLFMKEIFLSIFLCWSFCLGLKGEAFGNNSLTIPKVGMVFFDNPISMHEKPWGLKHQWGFGTSFMKALDYRWWWLIDTSFAIGPLTDSSTAKYLSSFMGGAGLRYDIFPDDFRPHTGLILHYVHFLGEAARGLSLDLDWPIFLGLKPFIGMEWLFLSEMSLSTEVAYGFYVNLNEPFRHILYANASFAFYF